MQKTKHRIQSMSMIHQKLYQEKNLSSIEMKTYFEELANYVVNVFDAEKRIEVFFEMNTLELEVDTAIPIGLIVNELLTNSLKYAFPNNQKGIIKIGLKKEHAQLFLKVSDNGIGKSDKEEYIGTGFGTKLIQLLTRQLEGKMKLDIENGTMVSFEFQYFKAA